MVGGQALSPGQVMVLLDPGGAPAREALKVTVLALVAQGALRIEERVSKGLFNREKRQTVLNLAPSGPTASPGPVNAVIETLKPIAPNGEPMPEVVSRLQKQFGQDLGGFVADHVRLALVARGLLEPRREKVLWLFPTTRYHHTPAGEAERGRLQDLMRQARDIPRFLDRDPAQAVALMAALGASVLLIAELKPYLAQLAGLMTSMSLGTTDFGDADVGSAFQGGDGLGALDVKGFDFDGFDLSALDALDQGLADFDASFDAGDGGGSDSGSNGGGD